ncbi:MAG: hypothetical protein Q9173_002040 [Seirophora scorigena]
MATAGSATAQSAVATPDHTEDDTQLELASRRHVQIPDHGDWKAEDAYIDGHTPYRNDKKVGVVVEAVTPCDILVPARPSAKHLRSSQGHGDTNQLYANGRHRTEVAITMKAIHKTLRARTE